MIGATPAMRERWATALRTGACTVGAFAVGSLATTVLSLVLAGLGTGRADAVTIALMAGPVLCALLSLAAFHGRSSIRTWGWLVGTALPLVMLIVALQPGASS